MLYAFYNNELEKHKDDNILKIYGATNDMYPTSLTYNLHNSQGQFMGFHNLILTLNSKIDFNSCISCGNISQIFCPKYERWF